VNRRPSFLWVRAFARARRRDLDARQSGHPFAPTAASKASSAGGLDLDQCHPSRAPPKRGTEAAPHPALREGQSSHASMDSLRHVSLLNSEIRQHLVGGASGRGPDTPARSDLGLVFLHPPAGWAAHWHCNMGGPASHFQLPCPLNRSGSRRSVRLGQPRR
jgi:hypothetical protein